MLEPTEYVLKRTEYTREESWNLPSMYWREMNALERKAGEKSWNLPSMYWREMNALEGKVET
jgi:hypothetical protein